VAPYKNTHNIFGPLIRRLDQVDFCVKTFNKSKNDLNDRHI